MTRTTQSTRRHWRDRYSWRNLRATGGAARDVLRANLGLGTADRHTGSTTVYLRVAEPQRRRARHSTPQQELAHAVHRYRVQLAPFLGTLWAVGVLRLAGHGTASTLVVLCLYLCIAAWVRRYGHRVGLNRPIERWYVAMCLAVVAGWHTWAVWSAVGTARVALSALLLTCLCAAPWWYHRRARGTIPVRMDGLDRVDRSLRIEQARKLTRDWTAFTSAGHLNGAKLQALTYNPWSVVLAVALRRGATVQEFTVRRLGKLESAFGDVRTGSARVERVDRHARLAMVRFMLDDPHEYPISPPETGQTSIERVVLGLFETGEEVLFLLVNTLVGGMTGSGKSGIMNVIVRALARMPQVAILGIDMKPGAPEFGKWRGVMHSLATDAAEVADLLDHLLEGLEYRGQVMSELGIRVWKATREQPFIVLLVDEVQELKAARLGGKLDRVTGMIRAYGGCVVVATQYPTKANVSTTVKENCLQKIGLRTEGATADRVIFGEGATRERWSPSTINSARNGSFFVRSPEYKLPLLARAYWLDDDFIDEEATRLAANRTVIDSGTWPVAAETASDSLAESGSSSHVALESSSDEVIEATIVDDNDPLELVLRALGRPDSNGKLGRRPIDIGAETGLSRATVYRKLKELAENGLASKLGDGRWERT